MSLTELIGEKNLNKMLDHFEYLYSRYLDEGKYENFNDYKKNVIAVFSKIKGINKIDLLEFTKRPFTIKFKVNDQTSIYFFKISGNKLSYTK